MLVAPVHWLSLFCHACNHCSRGYTPLRKWSGNLSDNQFIEKQFNQNQSINSLHWHLNWALCCLLRHKNTTHGLVVSIRCLLVDYCVQRLMLNYCFQFSSNHHRLGQLERMADDLPDWIQRKKHIYHIIIWIFIVAYISTFHAKIMSIEWLNKTLAKESFKSIIPFQHIQ